MSLTWIDQSDDEDLFRIFQRQLNGTLAWLTDVATADKPGTGQAMTHSVVVPTDTDCFEVASQDSARTWQSYSQEVCASPGPDLYGSVAKPGAPTLSATASQVQLYWLDNATNETGFSVAKRDAGGVLHYVYTVATRDTPGSGGDVYTWIDTDTSLSGQCYEVVTYNLANATASDEKCTVRPDGTRFPQNVPSGVVQWQGLSATATGVGNLLNLSKTLYLKYAHETLGVDLDWTDSAAESRFTVEVQGGPKLMKGQALAIHIPGQGYLTTGDPTFGIGLDTHHSAPSYEWYALGGSGPGETLNVGTFALWNKVRQDYLVWAPLSNGPGPIDIFWAKDVAGSTPPGTTTGVNTYRLFNCSMAQHSVDVWIKDLTSGAAFSHMATVNQQYGPGGCPDTSPTTGNAPFTYHPPVTSHHYLVVATDKQLVGCGGVDDPNIGSCRALAADFVSDLSYVKGVSWNGVVRSDVVNGSTLIVPCSVAVCGPVPTVPAPAPDFSITLDQPDGAMAGGDTMAVQVTFTALNGYTEGRTLVVTGLPNGVTASFAPGVVSFENPGSVLTLSASDTAASGTYPVTVRTDSTLDGPGKSVTYLLTIAGEGPPPGG